MHIKVFCLFVCFSVKKSFCCCCCCCCFLGGGLFLFLLFFVVAAAAAAAAFVFFLSNPTYRFRNSIEKQITNIKQISIHNPMQRDFPDFAATPFLSRCESVTSNEQHSRALVTNRTAVPESKHHNIIIFPERWR